MDRLSYLLELLRRYTQTQMQQRECSCWWTIIFLHIIWPKVK